MEALHSIYGTSLLALPMGTGKTTVSLNIYGILIFVLFFYIVLSKDVMRLEESYHF